MESAIEVSPTQFSRSAQTLFKSSVHSSYEASSSLLPGSIVTSSRIFAKMLSSSATTSTIPLCVLWKSAVEESHLEALFPSSALGELTNNFAFAFSIKVKSVKVGNSARPPPQLPKTAVI